MKYPVRPIHKGNTRWMTRPALAGEPEVYPYVFEGDDVNRHAWEQAQELNVAAVRVLVAA